MPHQDIKLAHKYINKLHSCKSRNIEFDLPFQSYKNLMRSKKCYYSGVALISGEASKHGDNVLTIDRIDNNKGYIKGNVVACSSLMNQLKNVAESRGMTFKELGRYMQKFDNEIRKRENKN